MQILKLLPMLVVVSAVLTGCLTQEERTFRNQQKYTQTHPGMEQCYMKATPEHPEHGAALLACYGETQADAGVSCIKRLAAQVSPAERRAFIECVLEARTEDRQLANALLMERAAHPPTRIVVPPAQVVLQPSQPPGPVHTNCTQIGFGVSCDSY
jgi:hypothetical protein